MRDGQPVKRAQRFAMRLHLIGLRSGCLGQFRHEGHDGVHFRIDAFDLLEVRCKRLARRQLSCADELSHLDGAQKTNIGGRRFATRDAGKK